MSAPTGHHSPKPRRRSSQPSPTDPAPAAAAQVDVTSGSAPTSAPISAPATATAAIPASNSSSGPSTGASPPSPRQFRPPLTAAPSAGRSRGRLRSWVASKSPLLPRRASAQADLGASGASKASRPTEPSWKRGQTLLPPDTLDRRIAALMGPSGSTPSSATLSAASFPTPDEDSPAQAQSAGGSTLGLPLGPARSRQSQHSASSSKSLNKSLRQRLLSNAGFCASPRRSRAPSATADSELAGLPTTLPASGLGQTTSTPQLDTDPRLSPTQPYSSSSAGSSRQHALSRSFASSPTPPHELILVPTPAETSSQPALDTPIEQDLGSVPRSVPASAQKTPSEEEYIKPSWKHYE